MFFMRCACARTGAGAGGEVAKLRGGADDNNAAIELVHRVVANVDGNLPHRRMMRQTLLRAATQASAPMRNPPSLDVPSLFAGALSNPSSNNR